MRWIISDRNFYIWPGQIILMQRAVEFYSPHPGFAGAIVSLPKSMYQAAHELDRKTGYVDEVLEKLRPLAEKLSGSVSDVKKYRFISFEYSSGPFCLQFCLIKYKKTGGEREPVQLRLPFDYYRPIK